MDLRAVQKSPKEQYRSDPSTSRIKLRSKSDQAATPIACSVDIGRFTMLKPIRGVVGAGTAACSGDLLLGALAACGQITCQMVASYADVDAAAKPSHRMGAGQLGSGNRSETSTMSRWLIFEV
jgi:hypothetical protein